MTNSGGPVRTAGFAVTLLSALLFLGCARQIVERELKQIDQAASFLPSPDSTLLKLHCRDGSMIMLDRWQCQKDQRIIRGSGVMFSFNRDTVSRGMFEIPYDSVAIAEVNRFVSAAAPTTGFAVMGTVTAAGAVICLTNPKACFGSCPTFYTWDGSSLSLMAEGFSASIAPSLAASDIDALYRAAPDGRTLGMVMKNEALETHVVQGVRLLAVPRPAGGRAFKSADGDFYQASAPVPPDSVLSPTGKAGDLLQSFDGREYYSTADSFSLATRETLDLYFTPGAIRTPGLVVAHRQTLMTTFLLYQTLAYMGKNAGYWLAKLEQSGDGMRSRVNGPGDLLGHIEILVQDGKRWIRAGEVGETGPISTDVTLVPFPEGIRSDNDRWHVRLRMARGYWRVDLAAMVDLVGPARPLRIAPAVVPGPGTDGSPRAATDTAWSEPIITLPGNSYLFSFTLPENPGEYEYFLDTRGYYLEWMRENWMPEENPDMVLLMLQDPGEYLQQMTPLFKRSEPTMEETFWRSKYERVQ
jgi:hypothetical protein